MKRMPVSLTELQSGQCRWVHGDPLNVEEHRYCGRDVVPGTSWCIRHLKRVTPAAEVIIIRELTKWVEGAVTQVRVASKMTDYDECLKEKRIPDVVEQICKGDVK